MADMAGLRTVAALRTDSPHSNASRSAPTSSRAARYVVAVLTLANVCAFLDRQVLSLVVEPMRHDLGLTDTQVSVVMGAGFVVFGAGLSIPLGRVADTRSRRWLLGVGLAVWAAMTAATGAVRNFLQLLVARAGVGTGEAALQPAALSLIADAVPRERLGRAMSTYTLGVFLGSGLAYLLGAAGLSWASRHSHELLLVLHTDRPWRGAFILLGGASLVLLPLIAALPDRRLRPVRSAPERTLMPFLRRHAALLVLQSTGFACSAAVNYGIAAWLATFFVRTYGWPATRAGTVQGVLTATVGVAATVWGGRLSDRLVARGHGDGPLLIGMVGAAGMFVVATLYPFMPEARWVVVLLVPVNVFAALPWGPATAAAAEVFPPELRARGASLNLFVVSLVSGVLGPTLVAVLTDDVFGRAGALRYSLALANVIGMGLTLALLAAARRPYRRAVAELGAVVAHA